MTRVSYVGCALMIGCAGMAEPVGMSDDRPIASAEAKADHWSAARTDLVVNGRNAFHYMSDRTVRVHAWFDHGFGGPSSTVTTEIGADQTFRLEWLGEWSYLDSYGAFVHLWIDADADGTCGVYDETFQFFVSNTFGGEPVEATIDFYARRSTIPIWCEEFLTTGEPAATPIDCDATCAGRGARDACFPQAACGAFCRERVIGRSQTIADAFEACMTSNPLCYDRPDDCVERTVPALEACALAGTSADDCFADAAGRE
jgi:hypothetical protein